MKFKNDIEKYEFFEAVLKNEIPQDKKNDFENELKNDKQLSREFDEHIIMSELVIDNSILDIKKNLVSIHNKFSGNSGSSSGKGKGFSTNNFMTLLIGGIILVTSILLTVKPKKAEPTGKEIIQNEQKTEQTEARNKAAKKIIRPEKKEVPQKETIDAVKDKTERIAEKPETEETEKQTPVVVPEEKEITKNSPIEEIENPIQTLDADLAENKSEKENTDEDAKEMDCKKIAIHCEYMSKESCVENNSGEIIIDKRSFTGGTPPYTVSINGGLDYYNSRYVFTSLKSGIYRLFVKDKNSCEKEIATITIGEKICNTDYKYSPEFGELWTIPVDKNKEGIFRLFNKNGQILVKRDINEYSDNTWNGKDDNGAELPMEYYPFVIHYSDGEVFKGSVTLVK